MKKAVLLILILILVSSPVLAQESEKIEFAQSRLKTLGYRPGSVDGYMGSNTRDAITAFQKQVGGLEVTQELDEETLVALEVPGVSDPNPNRTSPEKIHLEVNLDRQLLYLVENGDVENIFHISTGEAGTTPKGEYILKDSINRERFDENGWVTAISRQGEPQGRMYRPLVISRPNYLHGHFEVPPYPDSLGCIRIRPRHMDYIRKIVTPFQTRIFIY